MGGYEAKKVKDADSIYVQSFRAVKADLEHIPMLQYLVQTFETTMDHGRDETFRYNPELRSDAINLNLTTFTPFSQPLAFGPALKSASLVYLHHLEEGPRGQVGMGPTLQPLPLHLTL